MSTINSPVFFPKTCFCKVKHGQFRVSLKRISNSPFELFSLSLFYFLPLDVGMWDAEGKQEHKRRGSAAAAAAPAAATASRQAASRNVTGREYKTESEEGGRPYSVG